MNSRREPTHAGSWYTSDGKRLAQELNHHLGKVTALPDLSFEPPVTDAKAIIAPHAGYSYSGPCAAWAYASIPTDRMQVRAHTAPSNESKRVFLLGPSHHAHIPGVALSPFKSYGTPLGDIPLCENTISSLRATNAFLTTTKGIDEEEHSLEMHLPYIRHIFRGRDDVRLIPLIVGHPSDARVAEALAPYWQESDTFFIISSDFCHWGTRFDHTPYYPDAPPPPIPVPPVPRSTLPASFEPPKLFQQYSRANPNVPIWQSIQYMDHEGMDFLRRPGEFGALEKWEAYLARTKNTICGRHPITVLLQLVRRVYGEEEGFKPEFTFVRYEQSSKCSTSKDSSVSYVSGMLRLP